MNISLSYLLLTINNVISMEISILSDNNGHWDQNSSQKVNIKERECLELPQNWHILNLPKSTQFQMFPDKDCKGRMKSKISYNGMIDINSVKDGENYGYFKAIRNRFVHNESGKGRAFLKSAYSGDSTDEFIKTEDGAYYIELSY